MKVKSESEVAQSCDPMDCSLPDSSIRGIFQARVLEWGAIAFSLVQGTQVQSLGQENPLEEGMATHSGVPAWKIPWTEEPGGLWPIGSQTAGHD